MLVGLLLTLNIIVCIALIGVVLLQRSEGGALGGGGGPTGLVTTRAAGDLLTRTTWILFTLFLVLSLSLTLVGARERSSESVLERLKLQSVNPEALAKGRAGQPATPPSEAPAPTIPGTAQEPAKAPNAFTAPTPTIALPPSKAPATPSKP